MNIGSAGITLIKDFEKLELVAYMPTPDDVPTIGYGHTKGVKLGDTCTEEQAEAWLLEDLSDAQTCVNKRIAGINITQNQFDAAVSLCFNMAVWLSVGLLYFASCWMVTTAALLKPFPCGSNRDIKPSLD